MPKEIVYGKYEAAWFDPDNIELTPGAEPNGEGFEMRRSGAVVRWSKGHIEIGHAAIEATEHMERNPFYVQHTEASLADYIRVLQKAGRQAFGTKPW